MSRNYSRGFTVVELLIVVIVVAILATVTIVSYNGIARSAKEASLKSELSAEAKKLHIALVQEGALPDSGPANTSAVNYSYSKDGNKFCLSIRSVSTPGLKFKVSESSPVVEGECDILAKEVALGTNHTCVIASNNQAYCWGDNSNGGLGDGATSNKSTPTPVLQGAMPTGVTIQQLAVGNNHTCGLSSNDRAYCWGRNSAGQLGNNTSTGDRLTPVLVSQGAMPAGVAIQQLAASNHTCAVASNNQAYCWGSGYFGQLGEGTLGSSRSTPTRVLQGAIPDGISIQQVTVGWYHTCALASDGRVYCWGDNVNGQLGNGTTVSSSVPALISVNAIPGESTVRQLATGDHHTCALTSSNLVYCWGRARYGQLGNGTTTNSNVPVLVSQGAIPEGAIIKEITAGGEYTCVTTTDNQAYCWGHSTSGQLGDGITTNRTVPVLVSQGDIPAGVTVQKLVSGGNHSCILSSSHQVYCWGAGNRGQLGNGTTTSKSTPTTIVPFPTV